MVFTGRPSAGCAMCKRRKKKCDLTRPFCKQCENIGKQCPGVPNEVDTLFRNTLANPSAKSNGGAHSKLQPHKSSDEPRSEDSIPSTVPTDWLSTAVTYYFHLYSLKDLSTKQLNPWFELQSRFYVDSASDTGLHHAVTALAAMTMALDFQMPELANKASLAYGRALRAVNRSLADSNQSRRNDVAIGVFAMLSFELKQQDADFHLRYETHVEGMKQLLLLRGREQLEDPESFKVFRSIRPLIIYDHIIRRKGLIDSSDSMLIWTYVREGYVTPIDDLCVVAARLPTLLAQAKQLTTLSLHSQISRVVSDAIKLNGDLIQWRAAWQSYLRYQVDCCEKRRAEWWHGQMYVFTNFPSATLISQYNFLQIQVLEALLKGLNLSAAVESTTHLAGKDIVRQIQDSVDEICYVVPFISGYERPRVYPSYGEAMWILLPIVVVSLQQNICAEQKAWLNQKLTILNADFNLFNPAYVPYDILKFDQRLDAIPRSKTSLDLGKVLAMG